VWLQRDTIQTQSVCVRVRNTYLLTSWVLTHDTINYLVFHVCNEFSSCDTFAFLGRRRGIIIGRKKGKIVTWYGCRRKSVERNLAQVRIILVGELLEFHFLGAKCKQLCVKRRRICFPIPIFKR